MVLEFERSSAMEPMAVEACLSVKAVQVVPPFVVFHTPPWAPPRYTILTLPGSIASAVTRPETTGSVYDVSMGCGPTNFQAGFDAGTDGAKLARAASSAATFCSSCSTARWCAPAGTYVCG